MQKPLFSNNMLPIYSPSAKSRNRRVKRVNHRLRFWLAVVGCGLVISYLLTL